MRQLLSEAKDNDVWWEDPEELEARNSEARSRVPDMHELAMQGNNIFSKEHPYVDPGHFFQYSPADLGPSSQSAQSGLKMSVLGAPTPKQTDKYAHIILNSGVANPATKAAFLDFAHKAATNPEIKKSYNLTDNDLTNGVNNYLSAGYRPDHFNKVMHLPMQEKDAADLYFRNMHHSFQSLPDSFRFTDNKLENDLPSHAANYHNAQYSHNHIYNKYGSYNKPSGLDTVPDHVVSGLIAGAKHADSISPFLLYGKLNNKQGRYAVNRNDIDPHFAYNHIGWPEIVNSNKNLTPSTLINLIKKHGVYKDTDPKTNQEYEAKNTTLLDNIASHPNADSDVLDYMYPLAPHIAFSNSNLHPETVHDYFSNYIFNKDPRFIRQKGDDDYGARGKDELFNKALRHKNISPKTLQIMINSKDPLMLSNAAGHENTTPNQQKNIYHKLLRVLRNPSAKGADKDTANTILDTLYSNNNIDPRLRNFIEKRHPDLWNVKRNRSMYGDEI